MTSDPPSTRKQRTEASPRRHWPVALPRWFGLIAVLGPGLVLLLVLSSGSPTWATGRQSTLHQTLPTAEPTPATVPLTVTLTVTLQRPNAPPPSASWAVPVRLSLYPPGDSENVWDEWYLYLDQYGRWSGMLTLVPGLYDVRIKNLHTLRNVRRNVEFVGPMVLDMGELHEGDADNDNRVRITDFAILRNAYFSNKGDPNFDARADFDEDQRIRITDFALLRGSYFQTGDIEVGGAAAAAQVPHLAQAELRLEPSAAAVQVGDVLTVTITASSGADDFVGAEFELRFDPAVLQVVDDQGQPATQLQPIGPLTPVHNTVDVAAGTARYGAGTFGVARGKVPVALVRLRALRDTAFTVLDLAEEDIASTQGHSLLGAVHDATVYTGERLTSYYMPLVGVPRDASR